MGKRTDGSGDGAIPIHWKLEKLSSPGSEKPASNSFGRLFEGIELCSERFVSRESGVAVGPPSSPHLGKLLLGDGASSHPTTVHPRRGPRAAPLPGPRVSTSRDPPPAPRRGSACPSPLFFILYLIKCFTESLLSFPLYLLSFSLCCLVLPYLFCSHTHIHTPVPLYPFLLFLFFSLLFLLYICVHMLACMCVIVCVFKCVHTHSHAHGRNKNGEEGA